MNMNKEMYLKRLRSLIRALPEDERRTIIDFYREIIEDKIESGLTEAQAVAELGDVGALAQKILAENPNRKPHNANRVAGIAVASFFGVLIVAAIVVNVLNFMNLRAYTGNAQTAGQSPAGQIPGATEQETGTEEEKTVTAPVTGIKCIYVDAENKEVSLERGTGNDISMTYQTDKEQTFTFSMNNGVMKLINRQRFGFDLFHFISSAGTNRITVSVPESYAGEIYLNTSNGRVAVSDALQVSKLTCDSSNGAISISNVHAETVHVDTSNASLELTQLTAAKVDARTSNGRISVNDITSADIDLNSSNGSIKGNIVGEEQDYSIRTSTSNGKCSPANRSGGSKNLTCDTSNAEINIEFTK